MALNLWKEGWGTWVRTSSQVGQVWFWGVVYMPGRLIQKNKKKTPHPLLGLSGRWRHDTIHVCSPVCVLGSTENYLRLTLRLLVYGWALTEKWRMVCSCWNPPTHPTLPLCRLQSIILIPPPHHHHTTRERGDSLSWNLAHSTGWGNQLRPDWQPPYLIPFPCSVLRVLFLLLCRFALAVPPPPPPIVLFSSLSTDTERTSHHALWFPPPLLSVLHDLSLVLRQVLPENIFTV